MEIPYKGNSKPWKFLNFHINNQANSYLNLFSCKKLKLKLVWRQIHQIHLQMKSVMQPELQ